MRQKTLNIWKQSACAAVTLTVAGCAHSAHAPAIAPTPTAEPVAAAPAAAFQPYTLVNQSPPAPQVVTSRNRVLRLTKYNGQVMLADSAHRYYHVGRDAEGHLCPIYTDPATHINYPLYYDRDHDSYYRLAQYDGRYYRCYVGDSANRFYAVAPANVAEYNFRPEPPVIVNTIYNLYQPWPRHREHMHVPQPTWLAAIPLIAAAYFVLEPNRSNDWHPRPWTKLTSQPLRVVARPAPPVFVSRNIYQNIHQNINIVRNTVNVSVVNQRSTTMIHNGARSAGFVRHDSAASPPHNVALQMPPRAPGRPTPFHEPLAPHAPPQTTIARQPRAHPAPARPALLPSKPPLPSHLHSLNAQPSRPADVSAHPVLHPPVHAAVLRTAPLSERSVTIKHPAAVIHQAQMTHAHPLPPAVHTHPMIVAIPHPHSSPASLHASPQPHIAPQPHIFVQPRHQVTQPAIMRPHPVAIMRPHPVAITPPVSRTLPVRTTLPAPPRHPAPRVLPPARRIAPPPHPAVMHVAPRLPAPRPAIMHAAPHPSAPPHPAAPRPAARPPHKPQ